MKDRVISISLAVMLTLSVGLVGCGGEEAPEVTQYSLTISSTEGGSVIAPGEGTFSYDTGEMVNLIAGSAAGYEFVNWTGDVASVANASAAVTTVTMNGDCSITANFEEIPVYQLRVSSTEGGSVTDPGEGTFSYEEGALVDLVAAPDVGYVFANWSGDVGAIHDVYAVVTTVTMNGDYSISASFTEDEVVSFADPNLEAAVREAIGVPERALYGRDLEGLTELQAGQKGIADLTGLEYAMGLTSLALYNNHISDISPLASLTGLTSLDLGFNQISDISPLAGLTSLASLRLWFNQISDISPLASLTSLTGLRLLGNQISDISPLADLKGLTELGLSGHGIPDVSAVVDLNRLTLLYLIEAQISDISPLASLTGVTWLSLWGNQISDISPLASLTGLPSLDLGFNQISDISPLASLTRLTGLRLSGNQISDISPLASLTGLTALRLESNQVSDISALAGLTSLAFLELISNQISDISALVDNPGLGEGDRVYLENNPLSAASINTYIPQLQARGVSVDY